MECSFLATSLTFDTFRLPFTPVLVTQIFTILTWFSILERYKGARTIFILYVRIAVCRSCQCMMFSHVILPINFDTWLLPSRPRMIDAQLEKTWVNKIPVSCNYTKGS